MADTFDLSNPDKPTAPKKDPDATLDYSIDWTAWLTDIGDTIANVQWVVPAPLVQVSTVRSAGVCTVFLSGGIAGNKYQVTCRITTTGGRTDDRSIWIPVKDR